MLKKELTYAAYFFLFLAGLSISAYSASSFSIGSITSFFWNNSKKHTRPKVITLDPADCARNKSNVLKNTPIRKVNVLLYSKKQNKSLKLTSGDLKLRLFIALSDNVPKVSKWLI